MAAAPEFTHLHVHSEYSLLDGHSRLGDLVAEAKRQGMSALALTDHGVMYGALEFYEKARQVGIKPIVGVEAYVAARRLSDKENADRSSNHLTLLAKNEAGYRNLLALTTIAHTDGFYYRPRIDHDALVAHSEGLVALSGCPSGEVPYALRHEEPDRARKAAAFYRDLFGPDYYMEVQYHGIDFQPAQNRAVIELARELDIKVVCTNDSHFTRREQADAQDLLKCIQMQCLVDDPKRERVYTDEHYVKSPIEMEAVFGAELPEARRTTMEIAEKCNLELTFGRLDFPRLHFVPDGQSPQDFLAQMCWDGLPRRYERVTPEIEERLRYELDVVRTTGFAAYILFVWDFVDHARKQNIMCGPRGSAAGSIILYCLGITTIDPIAHGLTFERFLNPARIQMPDIDMDFADTRRDEVIEYVATHYGRDHVAQIVTFGRLLARAAIRDVGRALGYPLSEVDRVAKLIPTLPVGMTLDRALSVNPELKQLYDEQDHVKKLIDSARKVEGIARHASTHAAGVVVSGEPLGHHVPLQRGARGENVIMTQFDAHGLELIGLLKMDFLGLANLTLLERTLDLIKQTRGITLDLQKLPLEDAKTFDMLSRGDSTGVFQLEGSGMRRTLREFRPASVHHIAAVVALYRPGPMSHIPTYVAAKDGRQKVAYLHPKLEPILKETYGVIVYQDQVLQIVQAIAGFTLGQADILRRAMGKKIAEEMKRERDNFVDGAERNDVDPAVAAKIWEYIEPFAGYAFNRAHAFCYAYIAYHTAYLKCNYPAEYMAAMLTTQGDDTDKVAAAAGECRRLNIPILRPCVTKSDESFAVETLTGQAIADPSRLGVRFGLATIKNVGAGAARLIVEERKANGPYRSLEDLCERVDLRAVNRRVLEALAKSGALDDFGPRERVLAALERTMAAGQQAQKAAGVGQQSLFGGDSGTPTTTPLPIVPSVPERERLGWEKEALGFFLSKHPFESAARALAGRVTANTSQVTEEMKDERVTMAGAIAGMRRIMTKKGEAMAVAQLEDLHGTIEAVVFPRTYALTSEIWQDDNVVIVGGKIAVRADGRGDDEGKGRPEILVDTAEAWVPNDSDGGEDFAAMVSSSDQIVLAGSIALDNTDTYESDGLTSGEGIVPEADALPGVPTVAGQAQTLLTIEFRESGDRRNDLERLRLLKDLLAQSVGDDPYAITFVAGNRRSRLVGERLRLRYTADLAQAMEGILGAGCVSIAGAAAERAVEALA